jgi:predicted ferric reductase
MKHFGWHILAILSGLPFLLWLFGSPINYKLYSMPLIARGVGDVLGLCGFAMFALVIILSARLRVFEKFFKGINESYTAHHIFGGLALCLLLFHPLFLAFNFIAVSYTSAALFLLPSLDNLPKSFGIAGLAIMILALIITFYTKLKYQVWKFTHKFMGLAFLFAFFHVFLAGSNVAQNQWLKIYLLVLSFGAFAAYFYRVFYIDILPKGYKYVFQEIKEDKDKIWEITLKPQNREIKFAPGQFGFVKILSKNISREIHPFSFSSANGNPLKIAIKELGDYTNKMGSVGAGDLAFVEGPYGAFNFKNHKNKNQIWIAGGVGIAPFLSMLRSLYENNPDYKIDLYYSAKSRELFAFKEEIEKITENNKNFRVIFWATDQSGFLTANLVKDKTENLFEKDILICGPKPMMDSLKSQFVGFGVSEKKIHTEDFQLY